LNETLFISSHTKKLVPKELSPTPYQVFAEKRQKYKLVIVKKQEKIINNKNGLNFFNKEPIKDWLLKKVYSIKQPCMNSIVEKAIKSIYPRINNSTSISVSNSISVTPKNKTFLKPTFVIVNSKDKETVNQTQVVKLNTRSISINESPIKLHQKDSVDYDQVLTNISPIKPRKESSNFESPIKSMSTNTSFRFSTIEKKGNLNSSFKKIKLPNFNSIRY
jgi:hypothetical protein